MLITDVTVFDGYRRIDDCTVLVEDGKIVSLKADRDADTYRVDGRGKTLLPGLIDAHVHLWAPLATTEAAVFGVTTALDMFSPPEIVRQWEKGLTDVRTSSYPATAPGGHGTEFGVEVPTIGGPSEAESCVAARIAEGAAYIKIMYDTSHGAGHSIDKATLAALVDHAHARDKMAMVHVTIAEDAPRPSRRALTP
jgi:imidazolonepropionase-like amidohydrolase